MKDIFPKALVTAAVTLEDATSIGRVMQALVGKKVKLNTLESYILECCRFELKVREDRRSIDRDRKRKSRKEAM